MFFARFPILRLNIAHFRQDETRTVRLFRQIHGNDQQDVRKD